MRCVECWARCLRTGPHGVGQSPLKGVVPAEISTAESGQPVRVFGVSGRGARGSPPGGRPGQQWWPDSSLGGVGEATGDSCSKGSRVRCRELTLKERALGDPSSTLTREVPQRVGVRLLLQAGNGFTVLQTHLASKGTRGAEQLGRVKRPTLDFSSGRDLTVPESGACIGLSAVSLEHDSGPLCLSLSLSPSPHPVLSLKDKQTCQKKSSELQQEAFQREEGSVPSVVCPVSESHCGLC